MIMSQGYIDHINDLLTSFNCSIHGRWPNRKDCPHCIDLHNFKKNAKDQYGHHIYDEDGDRIGSGVGYGGGQGATY